MARIQPVLTPVELALIDQMAALTGSKRAEVIKSALKVYYWFVRQALTGCRQLYHVAAHYALWAKDPQIFYDINVTGTRALLEAARDIGIERIVYTSTTERAPRGSRTAMNATFAAYTRAGAPSAPTRATPAPLRRARRRRTRSPGSRFGERRARSDARATQQSNDR